MQFSKAYYFWEGVFILVGIIIGAGVFVLPYIGYHSGLITTFFWLIINTFILTYLHLAFGEVVLKTKEEYRLIGYAHHYLGPWARNLMLLTTFLTFSFSLLIYLLLGTQFLSSSFNYYSLKISPNLIFIFLWLILSLITLLGEQEDISKINFLFSFLLLILFALIIALSLPYFNPSNLNLFPLQDSSSLNSYLKFLLPYGVIFFALNGTVGVPELISNFKKRKIPLELSKKAIIWAMVLIFLCYFSFIFVLNGAIGKNITPEAINSLSTVVGSQALLIGALIGFLAVATSYIIFAIYIKNSFLKDIHLPLFLANLLIFLGPIGLYLLNVTNLITIISFVGGLVGGIEGLMILLVFREIKKQPLDFSQKEGYSLPFHRGLFIFLILALIFGVVCQIFLVPTY